MTLEKYGKEVVKEISMVEIAYEILSEEKKAMNFNEIFDLIAEAKEYTQEEKEEYIVQFYTDLNIDGRFMSVGTNIWGLKKWYPFDQQEDDTISFTEDEAPKKKKKKKKKEEKLLEEEVEPELGEDDFSDLQEGDNEELLDDDADEVIEDDDDEEKL
ncbi:DNA-directed RNA polymerase subunit delta [Aquisalibacillus elongatus]|uniref:Probable DNA-directed RNA polymerase subunit delta n=1 Tax=Aquisalibacillus elongatus TaxID=485577 RepID=A0A3N5CB86_9BACI|nr:DNA-directed RNA polymerase subunit delta [Aquisalibacillus elongatus]RPF54081.1 DNA-directed RNA polymerase subunit delta [Aquisalibacillus elongatus]